MIQNATRSFESLSNSLQKSLFSSVIVSCLGGGSFLFFSTVEYLNIETVGVKETSSARNLEIFYLPCTGTDWTSWQSFWSLFLILNCGTHIELLRLRGWSEAERLQLSLQLNADVTRQRPDLLAQTRKNTHVAPDSQQLGVVCYSEKASWLMS